MSLNTEKIDLNDIIGPVDEWYSQDRELIHKYMKEAIRQALVLASKHASMEDGNNFCNCGLCSIDEQSILDVEKLIV